MKKPNLQVDQQIATLIAEAQRLHKPQNVVPQPPTGQKVPSGASHSGAYEDEDEEADGELERITRPPWFEPKERVDADLPLDEVPIIGEPASVPDPTPAEEQEVERSGTEALAYYAPFHFYGQRYWGIYIRDKGLVELACKYKGSRLLSPSDSWILRSAYYFLLGHEYFHFQTEVAVTRFEFVSSISNSYGTFFHDTNATWLEEGMANANAFMKLHEHEDAYLSLGQLQSFKDFSARWMKSSQPAGYRDFDRWSRSKYYYGKGMRFMTSRLLELSGMHNPLASSVDPYSLELYKRSKYSRVPVMRVHDSTMPWLKTAKMFPKANGVQVFVYTRDHKPVHLHAEFPGSGKSTKLVWPTLMPIRNEPTLTRQERSSLSTYMNQYHDEIHAKLCLAYGENELPRMDNMNL